MGRARAHGGEFDELIEFEALYYGDGLSEVDEERYLELDYRRYSFGVAGNPFTEPPVDAVGLLEEFYDLVSGATFTVALGELFTEPGVGVSVQLANGPADRLLDLPIPELDAFMALFVDVRALNSTAPEPEEWLEPVSVVTMVYGTDGSGIIRVLID